jgi:hypothetical protein
VIEAASFRRTLFLTRVPKGTGRFLMRRLANLIYFAFISKKIQCALLLKKTLAPYSQPVEAETQNVLQVIMIPFRAPLRRNTKLGRLAAHSSHRHHFTPVPLPRIDPPIPHSLLPSACSHDPLSSPPRIAKFTIASAAPFQLLLPPAQKP